MGTSASAEGRTSRVSFVDPITITSSTSSSDISSLASPDQGVTSSIILSRLPSLCTGSLSDLIVPTPGPATPLIRVHSVNKSLSGTLPTSPPFSQNECDTPMTWASIAKFMNGCLAQYGAQTPVRALLALSLQSLTF